ncbi:unnamed protein product [Cercopithifilaria johnstoni]|uniref:Uncharacterized protein n=1 Tax=Cercopithifilaria johnstoni TaxID=2874296 RepID=A0A8J2MQS2_9BILA|nr:unnamed protein product [Cercopithifilaria johnstoni]
MTINTIGRRLYIPIGIIHSQTYIDEGRGEGEEWGGRGRGVHGRHAASIPTILSQGIFCDATHMRRFLLSSLSLSQAMSVILVLHMWCARMQVHAGVGMCVCGHMRAYASGYVHVNVHVCGRAWVCGWMNGYMRVLPFIDVSYIVGSCSKGSEMGVNDDDDNGDSISDTLSAGSLFPLSISLHIRGTYILPRLLPESRHILSTCS